MTAVAWPGPAAPSASQLAEEADRPARVARSRPPDARPLQLIVVPDGAASRLAHRGRAPEWGAGDRASRRPARSCSAPTATTCYAHAPPRAGPPGAAPGGTGAGCHSGSTRATPSGPRASGTGWVCSTSTWPWRAGRVPDLRALDGALRGLGDHGRGRLRPRRLGRDRPGAAEPDAVASTPLLASAGRGRGFRRGGAGHHRAHAGPVRARPGSGRSAGGTAWRPGCWPGAGGSWWPCSSSALVQLRRRADGRAVRPSMRAGRWPRKLWSGPELDPNPGTRSSLKSYVQSAPSAHRTRPFSAGAGGTS